MSLIEIMVVLVIFAITAVLGAMAFGAVSGSELNQSAGELASAVRYTYNLAAINNKAYALYIDLDQGTYHAAPVDDTGGECERVLLAPNGSDSDPLIVRYGDVKGEGKDASIFDEDSDDEEGGRPGMFDAAMAGAGGDNDEPAPPTWSDDGGTASGRLWSMLGKQTQSLAKEESAKAGYDLDEDTGEQKRMPTMRKNMLAKPKPLGKAVSFDGIVVRNGQEPVTEGVVPILFFPHGLTQRALIYLKAGDDDIVTVSILSLQGNGKVFGERLDPSEFEEKAD